MCAPTAGARPTGGPTWRSGRTRCGPRGQGRRGDPGRAAAVLPARDLALALAQHLGAAADNVAAWEARGASSPLYRTRIEGFLAYHLATPEGEAFGGRSAMARRCQRRNGREQG